VVLAAVVAAMLWAQLSGPVGRPSLFRAADTRLVTRGARVALDCVKEHHLRSCGRPAPALPLGDARVPATRVERFPLLLYVPTVAAYAVGLGPDAALRLIGLLNGAAFVFLAALPWLTRRRLPRLHQHRFLWAVLLLSSPLLPYAASTWSEAMAAALLVAAVAGTAARWPWAWVAVLAFAAGISKDIVPPVTVLLATAAGARGDGWRTRLHALAPVLAGSGAALAANAAFNVFRFGTLRNLTYLDAAVRVTRPGHVAQQLLAVVLSPSGGLLAFWPALLVLGGVGAVIGWRGPAETRLRLAAAATALLVFCLVAAAWYAPFGWVAWGPRIVMPVVPAVILAVLLTAEQTITLSAPAAAALAAAVVLSVPNVAVLAAPDEVVRFIAAPIGCHPPPTAATGDAFVACNMRRVWSTPVLPVRVLRGLGDARTAGLAVLVVGSGLALTAAAAGARGWEPTPRRRSSRTRPA
jgi:hypothetical protein